MIVFFYILIFICLLGAILMILKPSDFTKLDIKYFSVLSKLQGYDAELKPTSPNKPEKITRIYGIILIPFFLLVLILVYLTTK